MPRGGRRDGAGRKKGSRTRRTEKTTEIAEKAAGEGPLPLEVMLKAMRAADARGDLAAAAAFAKDAAPYLHPRLQSVEVGGKAGGPPVPVQFVEVARGGSES